MLGVHWRKRGGEETGNERSEPEIRFKWIQIRSRGASVRPRTFFFSPPERRETWMTVSLINLYFETDPRACLPSPKSGYYRSVAICRRQAGLMVAAMDMYRTVKDENFQSPHTTPVTSLRPFPSAILEAIDHRSRNSRRRRIDHLGRVRPLICLLDRRWITCPIIPDDTIERRHAPTMV